MPQSRVKKKLDLHRNGGRVSLAAYARAVEGRRCSYAGCEGWSNSRINADALFILAEILVSYHAVNLCKKCVVTTAANVGTWVDFGSELTYKNVSGFYYLSAEALHSPSLSFTVASVSRTTTSFLMCHCITPSAASLYKALPASYHIIAERGSVTAQSVNYA